MRWAGLGGRGDECAAGVRPISATKGRLIDEMSVERVIRLFCLLSEADVGQDTRAWLMLRLKMAKTSCCVTASVRFLGQSVTWLGSGSEPPDSSGRTGWTGTGTRDKPDPSLWKD